MHCSVIKVPFPPPFFRASFAILPNLFNRVNTFLKKIFSCLLGYILSSFRIQKTPLLLI